MKKKEDPKRIRYRVEENDVVPSSLSKETLSRGGMRGRGAGPQSGTAMKVHSDFFDAARPAGAGWGFGSGPFLLTFAFLQEWSFPACTVNNDKTEHKCTVCRAWRPAFKPIGRTSKVPAKQLKPNGFRRERRPGSGPYTKPQQSQS